MKTRGVISSGHEITSLAGSEILASGGNAFDAILAAMITSFVAEPCMSSPGGGGFMTGIYEGKPVYCDFFCQTPLQRKARKEVDFYPVDINFGATTEVFHVGNGSVAVPGSIAGVSSIHKQFCTMPLKEITSFAIDLAKKGVKVNDFQHYDIQLLEPILAVTEDAKHIFFPDGKLIQKGDLLKMEGFADFLEVFVLEGERFFYEGEIAQLIERDVYQKGGYIGREDLARYKARIMPALDFQLGHYHVFTNPPPSVGGTVLHLIFDQLEQYELPSDFGNTSLMSKLCEIFRDVETIRGKEGAIDRYQTEIYPHHQHWGSTTHMSVIDENGNSAAISTTNGQGSGYSVPGADILLNNMLGEGALFPLGFHNWKVNTRVPSMMAPTIVKHSSQDTLLSLGTGGAGRIPYSIAQVLINLLYYKLEPGQAIDCPRIYFEKGTLNIEPGINLPAKLPSVVDKVVRWDNNDMFFGGVHTVIKQGKDFRGVGDKRRHGVVEYVR